MGIFVQVYESEVILYKKCEELSKSFGRYMYSIKREFSVKDQEFLRDFLRLQFKILSAKFTKDLSKTDENFEEFHRNFNEELNKILFDEYKKNQADLTKLEETRHEILPIYTRRKYLIALRHI
jgi:hypothetical protein